MVGISSRINSVVFIVPLKGGEFILDDFSCVIDPALLDLFFEQVIALALFEFREILFLHVFQNRIALSIGNMGVGMRSFIEIGIEDFRAI